MNYGHYRASFVTIALSRLVMVSQHQESSYIKDILTREFEDRIGFHSRPQMNHSDLFYDTSGSGLYVEAALSSIGVSSEQLVHNVAIRLRDDIKSVQLVPCPPRVEELEEEEELSTLTVQLLSALRGKKGVDLSPSTLSLTSIITQYVTVYPPLPPSMPPSRFMGWLVVKSSLTLCTNSEWVSATQTCFLLRDV